MSTETKIQWTDHTFNPWWGCARVSPACRFCYADTTATRWGHELWRRKGPRRMMSDANWRNPVKWNRDAEKAGTPAKVFCASMADVFEVHPMPEVNAQLDAARARLWALIEQTPWLIWQLLTKRPENVAGLAPWGQEWPSHVWLGTSVEDQRRAVERIPVLLHIPAVVHFLSCEPLLGPVNLTDVSGHPGFSHDALRGELMRAGWLGIRGPETGARVAWVIVGGESGSSARAMNPAWAASIVEQCRLGDVACFVKQLGSAHGPHKGGPIETWPSELQVREFPAVPA